MEKPLNYIKENWSEFTLYPILTTLMLSMMYISINSRYPEKIKKLPATQPTASLESLLID